MKLKNVLVILLISASNGKLNSFCDLIDGYFNCKSSFSAALQTIANKSTEIYSLFRLVQEYSKNENDFFCSLRYKILPVDNFDNIMPGQTINLDLKFGRVLNLDTCVIGYLLATSDLMGGVLRGKLLFLDPESKYSASRAIMKNVIMTIIFGKYIQNIIVSSDVLLDGNVFEILVD